MAKLTDEEILDFSFESEDLGKTTIRTYLWRLLETLWSEGEGFSGKRPFGNSGWEFDLYKGLVRAGAVKGAFEEENDYHLAEFDKSAANKKIFALIKVCCGVK